MMHKENNRGWECGQHYWETGEAALEPLLFHRLKIPYAYAAAHFYVKRSGGHW